MMENELKACYTYYLLGAKQVMDLYFDTLTTPKPLLTAAICPSGCKAQGFWLEALAVLR